MLESTAVTLKLQFSTLNIPFWPVQMIHSCITFTHMNYSHSTYMCQLWSKLRNNLNVVSLTLLFIFITFIYKKSHRKTVVKYLYDYCNMRYLLVMNNDDFTSFFASPKLLSIHSMNLFTFIWTSAAKTSRVCTLYITIYLHLIRKKFVDIAWK